MFRSPGCFRPRPQGAVRSGSLPPRFSCFNPTFPVGNDTREAYASPLEIPSFSCFLAPRSRYICRIPEIRMGLCCPYRPRIRVSFVCHCFVVLRAIRLPQPTQERRVPWQRLGRSRPQLRRHAPRIFSSLPENQLRAACR